MKKLLFVLSVILLISLNYSCNHENDLQVKGEEASLYEDSGFLDQIKGKSLNTFPIEYFRIISLNIMVSCHFGAMGKESFLFI